MPHLTCRLAAVAWVAASLCIKDAVAPDWCFLWVLWHKAAQPHARPIRLTAVAHKHEVRQAVFPKETAILIVEIHRVHARWLLLQPHLHAQGMGFAERTHAISDGRRAQPADRAVAEGLKLGEVRAVWQRERIVQVEASVVMPDTDLACEGSNGRLVIPHDAQVHWMFCSSGEWLLLQPSPQCLQKSWSRRQQGRLALVEELRELRVPRRCRGW